MPPIPNHRYFQIKISIIFHRFYELNKYSLFADSLSERGFAVSDNFFSTNELRGFYKALAQSLEDDDFKQAGIGTGADFQKNKSIRGDKIVWIGENNYDGLLDSWHKFIKELCDYLNFNLFVGIRDKEFHFAFYPKGAFYEKHIDQFKGRNNRLISCVLYLNESWQPGNGGELVLYLDDDQKEIITPTFGKMVCFRSELFEHEVLITNSNRYSITGWLLNYQKGLGFLGY